MNYNDLQKAVVDQNGGILRVTAGAGSGKTQTIAGHISRLVKEEQIDPNKILCITFSNAGAKEMIHKIKREIGSKAEDILITTFNAFAFDIVKKNATELGFQRIPNVINDVQKFAIIRDLLKDNPILTWSGASFRMFTNSSGYGTKGALLIVADVFDAIREVGGSSSNPKADLTVFMTDDIDFNTMQAMIALYDKYDAILMERGLLTFSDQEVYAMKVLETHPDYLDDMYSHIIVDEFQDTSRLEMEYVKHLKVASGMEELMVVGDDSQSIYGFRNTSPQFLIQFDTYVNEPLIRFTDSTEILRQNKRMLTKELQLVDNYRSTQNILDAAEEVLHSDDNNHLHLVAARGHGADVVVNPFLKRDAEASWIAKSIKEKIQSGVNPESIAIIAATKGELRYFADSLTKEGIPSMFGAPQPLYVNSRVRAILAFARYLQNQWDRKDLIICANAWMKGGFLTASEEEQNKAIGKVQDLSEEIKTSVDERQKKELFIGFMDEISMDDEAVEFFKTAFDNLDYLESLIYCRDFEELGKGQEFRMTDSYPGVFLVTAHSSKGCEWDVVYNSIDRYGDSGGNYATEDLRLLYVSMTRARNELFVTGTFEAAKSTIRDPHYSGLMKKVLHVVDKEFDSELVDALATAAKIKKTKAVKEKNRRKAD